MTTAAIIAPTPDAWTELWGMGLAEKTLRQLSVAGFAKAFILIDNTQKTDALLRRDLAAWHSIEVVAVQTNSASIAETLASLVREVAAPMLVVDAEAGYDGRIFDRLKIEIESGTRVALSEADTDDTPAVFTLHPEDADKIVSCANLVQIRDALGLQSLSTSDMDAYMKKIRKRLIPYAIPVHDDKELKHLEKVSFDSVYKGATDFITKYVFPTPVRYFTRAFSRTYSTPNHLTYLSMILSFGAIPLFFLGNYWPAIVMGFSMAFLDTADGKLARTTLRTSTSGDLLDHVSDTVYLLFWYIGTGYFFSGGAAFDFGNPATVAGWVLVASFVVDKILTGLFKRIYGQELHDYARLDYITRTFIARRNPFLVCMLVAMLIGNPIFGLYAIAFWNAATLLFHLIRFLYLPLSGQRHQSLESPG